MDKNLDQKGYGGAVLMDLSIAFDILNHDLLSAKPHAYDFDRDWLKVLHSYVSSGYQRTKINKSFSSWSKIIFGYHKILFFFFSSLIFGLHLLLYFSSKI